MKFSALFVASTIATASAFAPAPVVGRMSTAQDALADRIFGMDLFDGKKAEYGARKSKNIKQGTLSKNSYVPSGLTRDQYDKIRKNEVKKREENYQRNVAKAFKFEDFTEWYVKRGTDSEFGWKSVTNGHRMVKTKFDWSGTADAKKFESTKADKFASAFNRKPNAKKAAAAPKKSNISKFRGY